MKPVKTGKVDIQEYNQPTGGWGSAQSLIRNAAGQGLAFSADLWATLLRQNKADAYMCVSCSRAKPEEPHLFEFGEDGAKATFWDQTSYRCDRSFFEKQTLTELLDWPNHDLEKQGRLRNPMRYKRETGRHEPVAWEDAFRHIGTELNALDPKSVVFYISGRAALETSLMYQLLARIYGSSNLSESSNICHVPAAKSVPVRITG